MALQSIQNGDFLPSMLKSTCLAEHFLHKANALKGEESETFQHMLDAHDAANIAPKEPINLVDEIITPSLTANVNVPIVATSGTEKPNSIIHAEDFIKSIWPKAKQAAALIGLDPKLLLAQAALETGWGKFIAKDSDGTSSNNLFNIKAPIDSTEAVNIKTTEYLANGPIKVTASFKKYPSIDKSFNDYVDLIKDSSRYQEALRNVASPENYVNELYKAGYATDPHYGAKILSIYYGNELNQALQQCGV